MTRLRLFRQFEENTVGNDYVVGDIHGCFSYLRELLKLVGFDETKDRLFSVGDLIDRGPDCEQVGEWLSYPWFFAVRGNHEQLILQYDLTSDEDCRIAVQNGAGWWLYLPDQERREYRLLFGSLPVAIQVGDVGLVHADVPRSDWDWFRITLEDFWHTPTINHAVWSRDRARKQEVGRDGRVLTKVKGIRAAVVGHSVMKKMKIRHENVYHIDTGFCYGGKFTLLNLKTLEVAAELKAPEGFEYPHGVKY